MREIRRQFLTFGVVGSIGFIVDAGSLEMIVWATGMSPYLGRIFSYLIAATVTWMLNRTFTFRHRHAARAHHQWLRYLLVNSIGALFNYGTFSTLIYFSAFIYTHLYLGVMAGAIVGLLFNFNLSRHWVFRAP